MMTEKTVCSRCGKPAAGEDQIGLCNDCLLAVGLGSVVDATAAGRDARFVPPEVSEIAPYFPQLDISELLGCGGMGAVYKARQKNLDRLVALKILPPDIGSAPAFAERFAREAKALAKLNHPNIVTLYEFGQAGELFYFLMEYVDGVNLGQLLRSGRVSPREALAIVPQICDALQYAHDAGIVHRDIKPENILLDRKGRVKVADFGLAKLVGSASLDGTNGTNGTDGQGEVVTTTEAGHVMGTPQYMAPEQVAHPSDVDHRADIYSLGVVFYQMLTGELPKGDFVAPSKKVVVDVRLDEVVLRAMERRPELRYQQVSDVKTMVETIATTPPPASPPAASLRTGGAPVCERPDFISKLLLFSPIIGVRNGRRVIHWAGARSNGILSLGVMAVVFIPLALSGEHIYGWLVSLTLFVLGMIVAGIVRDCRKPIEQLPCLDEKEVSKNPPAFAVFGSLYGVLVFVLMASASWLPDRVACHFGLDGNADDWMGRVPYLLLIGAIPAVLALLFALVSRRIRTAGASFVNIPRRDYWLAPERRDRTAALIRDRLTWLLCLLTLFFGSLHVLSVAANRTRPPHLNMGALLVVVIVFLVAQMQWLFMLVMRFAEADDKCGGTAPPQLPIIGKDGGENSQALKKSASVQTAPAASQTWQSPTMGWGHFIGYLQGITFTSPLAYKLANLSALGFLCFLGFMPLPGWKGFFGFSGIFGLIGLSTLIEMVARSRARRSGSNNQQPPRGLNLGRWQGVLLLFGLILLSVAAFVAVLKQVISQQNPGVIQQTSGNQGTVFGPVIERVVQNEEAIDFDSGKQLQTPEFKLKKANDGMFAGMPEGVAMLVAWMEQQGMDARFDASSLTAFGMKVTALTNADWDRMSPAQLAEGIHSIDSTARPHVLLEPGTNQPATYAFQTRECGKGILQVTAFTDNGVKLRYKLVLGGATQAIPNPRAAVQLIPGLVNAERKVDELIAKNDVSGLLAWIDGTVQPLADLVEGYLIGTELTERAQVITGRVMALRRAVGKEDWNAVAALTSGNLDKTFIADLQRLSDQTHSSKNAAVAKPSPAAAKPAFVNAIGTVGKTEDAASQQTAGKKARLTIVSFSIPSCYTQPVVNNLDAKRTMSVDVWDADLKNLLAHGILVAVDNQIDEATGMLPCKATVSPTKDTLLYPNQFVNVRLFLEPQPGAATESATNAVAPADAVPVPKITTDQVIVEDLSLQMLVAIREKDDSKLRALACDNVEGWRDVLPNFAVEMREHYRQLTGNEALDLHAVEALVDGNLAVVKCTGPKELNGIYLVLFFVKTNDGWRNWTLRNSPPERRLNEFMKEKSPAAANPPPSAR